MIRSRWEYPGEDIVNSEKTKQQMVYFRLLLLNPLKVVLTLSSSEADALLKLPPSPVTVLLETVLGTVANLDAAPLCFNALLLTNMFVPVAELQSRVVQHYVRQGVQQVYKILGSTEALGNPVGLFANISTGVHDLFYEPRQGIVESPQAFARGLAKGTTSLIKNTVYGAFNSMGKAVGALGKGVATLSMDKDYIRRRARNQRAKPRHVLEGTAQGALAVGRGLVDGLAGIVLQPIAGARREGALGLFKGIGMGVVGVAVKPVAGVLEGITKTAEGVKNTTTLFDDDKQLYRVRPAPRRFGPDRQLLAFDDDDCFGTALVLQCDELLHGDRHVLHTPLAARGLVALLTDAHVALLRGTGPHPTAYRAKACYALRDVRACDLQSAPAAAAASAAAAADGGGAAGGAPASVVVLMLEDPKQQKQHQLALHVASPDAALAFYTKLRSCLNTIAAAK